MIDPWRKQTVNEKGRFVKTGTKVDDPDLLRELYYKKRMTLQEMADELGTSATTVRRYMENHGIERRGRGVMINTPVHLRWKDGYRVWATTINGKQETVRVHRLTAVAEFGFEAVCGKVVHHKNDMRCDNRSENLELMRREEHSRHHYKQQTIDEKGMVGGKNYGK